MQKLIGCSNTFRSPLIYNSEYSNLFKYIAFTVNASYETFIEREYSCINIKEFIKNGKFIPFNDPLMANVAYAYGILINPLHSNLIVLDFDDTNISTIDKVIENFKSLSITRHIDLISSSRYGKSNINFTENIIEQSKDTTTGKEHFHLHVGLDKPYNTLPLYNNLIPGVCKGFLNCIKSKNEVVIRISEKFNNTQQTRQSGDIFAIPQQQDSTPIWKTGYSYIKEDNKWQTYSSEQLIVPLTTADGVYSDVIQNQTRRSLKLRG